jgi:hypothetical protein
MYPEPRKGKETLMKGTLGYLPLLALATLLAGASAAPAEMTHWSYSAGTDPQDLPAGNGHDQGIGGPFNGLHFFYERSDSQINSAQILLVRMQPFDIRDFHNRGTVVPFNNAPFTLNLGLGDTASGALGNLIFPGLVNGSSDTGIRLTFTVPTTQDLVLGQNRYSVHLGPYVSPGPLDSGQLGSLSADVDVHSVNSTPEPSCLVLAGMGLVTVAGAAWRKRRRQTVS